MVGLEYKPTGGKGISVGIAILWTVGVAVFGSTVYSLMYTPQRNPIEGLPRNIPVMNQAERERYDAEKDPQKKAAMMTEATLKFYLPPNPVALPPITEEEVRRAKMELAEAELKRGRVQ